MRTQSRSLLAVFLLCALAILPGVAQEFRATLNGTVTDSQGAVIPGATVTATQTNTGSRSEATAGAGGQYTLPFLAPGNYTVEATSRASSASVRKTSSWAPTSVSPSTSIWRLATSSRR